jgi:Predicted aminopeptidases
MSRTFAAIVGLASVAVIGGACAPGLSPSQNSAIVPSPAAGTAIDEADVRRILSALADDSMQGRLAGTAGADRAAAYIDREMRSIALTPAGDSGYYQKVALAVTGNSLSVLDSFDALAALPTDQRRIGYNMIGAVRGSDPVLRDQIVVIAAHYDHLGIGMPVNGDSIYNGADDDASGVTAVLEIARSMIAGPRPRRTMVFIATTGEEEGILGTQWYVKHPEFPLSKMVAEMEVEMIGRPDSLAGGPGKGWLTGYDRSTMGDMLKAAGVPIVPDPYPQMHFYERSDNIVFAQMGIPAHTLSSYNLHSDYHRPSDEVSRIDFAHVTAVVRAGAMAARFFRTVPRPRGNRAGNPCPTIDARYRFIPTEPVGETHHGSLDHRETHRVTTT